jgi:hypothetical protein
MTRLLLSAVALAACSSEAPRNESAVPTAPATFAPVEVAPTPVASLDTGAKPRPGEVRTFGDWTVGCDNTLRCELRSLAAENAEPGDPTVSIARDAGPEGKFEVTIDGYEDAGAAAAVDGQPVATRAGIVSAMANGRVLALLAGGKAVATVSLNGASAALRYVDAVQGRAGTVTALVARGRKPARAVPAAPPAPTIVAMRFSGQTAKPTAAQLGEMRRIAECDADALAAGRLEEPEAYALGAGKTLVLLPCSAGAYNMLSAVFVLDGTGVAPVRADAPVGFDADGKGIPTVVNGGVDKGLLGSFAKARGLGDCGVIQSFVWDGARLRLSLQQQMGVCRGNTAYITTWRANVAPR